MSKHQHCHCCPTEDLPKNQVTTGLGWSVFSCSGCPRFRAILLYQCARPDCLLCLGWGAARSMQETWQVLDQTSLHCALRVTHMCCVPHEWSPGFPSLFFPSYTITSQRALSLPYKMPKLGHPIYASIHSLLRLSSVQFSHSVMPTLCDPVNCSMPGLPVHHQLPESTQTHVH